jgi:hypothetical protein
VHEQLDLTGEDGWEPSSSRSSAEFISQSEDGRILEFCLEGLRVTVEAKKMTPEQAKDHLYTWFGRYFDF